MVDKNVISDNLFKYLQAYVEVTDSLLNEDATAGDDDSEEIQKLKALIHDLRADRIQLQQELDQFKSQPHDSQQTLKLKNMQDDIEFFTGENLELQQKVKEVC